MQTATPTPTIVEDLTDELTKLLRSPGDRSRTKLASLVGSAAASGPQIAATAARLLARFAKLHPSVGADPEFLFVESLFSAAVYTKESYSDYVADFGPTQGLNVSVSRFSKPGATSFELPTVGDLVQLRDETSLDRYLGQVEGHASSTHFVARIVGPAAWL